MDDIPHLALPIRLSSGSYVTNPQDSNDEGAACVAAILKFARNTRVEDVDFGIEDPTFQVQPVDIDDIAQAISTYEPRVNADIISTDNPDGTSTVVVKVSMPTSDDVIE
jgi:hypothetical protein